jgi:hypothetical protein
MSRIRVEIDRLVLPEMPIADRRALVEGLQSELTRILSDPAIRTELARSWRAPVLRLGDMPFQSRRAEARNFGCRMARAIGKGLKR